MTHQTKRIFFTLLAIDVFLLVLHLVFGEWYDLFHLDREYNIPTYWSGIKLIVLATLAAGLGLLARQRAKKVGWGILTAFFLYIALDDISEIHEHVTYYISTYIRPFQYFRSPTYMWLVFFSPFIIGGLMFLIAFLKKIKAIRMEKRITLAGMFFFIAAFALEFSGAFIHDTTLLRWEVFFEEGSEFFGVTCFITVFISMIYRHFFERFTEKNMSAI